MKDLDWEKIRRFIEVFQPSLLQKSQEDLDILAEVAYPYMSWYKDCLKEDFSQGMAFSMIHMGMYSDWVKNENLGEGEISSISQGNSTVSYFQETITSEPISSNSSFWNSTPAGSLLINLLSSKSCFKSFASGLGGLC